MDSKAKPLRDEVKRRFYPLVEQRGFVRQKSESPYFVTFLRDREGKIDFMDLQWDKSWRPYFVVNFGQGHAGDKDSDIVSVGRLQRRRGSFMRNWFNLNRSWLSKLTTGKWRYSAAEVVDELLLAFEELEAWFQHREVGPHINLYPTQS